MTMSGNGTFTSVDVELNINMKVGEKSRLKYPPLLKELSDSDAEDIDPSATSKEIEKAPLTPAVENELRRIQIGHNLSSVLALDDGSEMGDSFASQLSNVARNMFDREDFDTSNLPLQSVIAKVDLHDFDDYMRRVAPYVGLFLHNHTNISSSSFSDGDVNGSKFRRNSRVQRLSASEVRHKQLLRSSKQLEDSSPKELLNLCFKTLPERFFNRDFTVDFGDQSQTNNTRAFMLQEKLSNWLDIVEVCLWKQTTSQAQSFFNTLSDLKNLKAQVRSACDTIKTLRTHMKEIRDSLAIKHLMVLQMKRRIENLNNLVHITKLIGQVRQTIPTVDRLLAISHDYGGALEIIEESKNVLNTELKGVKSLRTLYRQLDDYQEMIGERLCGSFIDLAINWEASMPDTTEENDVEGDELELLKSLKPIVHGLLRQDKEHMHRVLELYRTRVVDEVKRCAKNSVTEALNALETENGTDEPLSGIDKEKDENTRIERQKASMEQLLSLSTDDFLSFIELIFYNLEMVMTRSHRVHLILSKILDTAAGEDIPGNCDRLRKDSEEIVAVICELAQQSVKQLLIVRLEIHSKLRMEEFKDLWDSVLGFVVKGDQMSGRPGFELRGALLMQAKKFLETLHTKQLKTLGEVLNREEWKQCDVPFEIQALTQRLVRGKLSGPRIFSSSNDAKGKRMAGRELVISGRSFRVVNSLLMLLSFLERYLSCATQFSALSSSVLSKITEMFRFYNERSNKLVLQAEACKTAGLKRINTKNLALSSQSLSVILSLMDIVKKLLSPCLPDKYQSHLNVEIERLVTEYETHKKRIGDKFAEMIENLIDHCCITGMATVQWDARNADGLGKPQEYMTKMTHGVTSMYNVLHKHFPNDELQQLFVPIFNLFNTKIPEAFAKIEPTTPTGKSRVRVDVNHLLSSLRRLRGLNGPGDSLELFLAEKFGNPSAALPVTKASMEKTIIGEETHNSDTQIAPEVTPPEALASEKEENKKIEGKKPAMEPDNSDEADGAENDIQDTNGSVEAQMDCQEDDQE